MCHFYKALGHSDVNCRGNPQLQNMDMGRRIGPMKTKVVYREKEHVHPTVVVNHDKGDQDQSLRGNTSGVNKVLKEKNIETTIIIQKVFPLDKYSSLNNGKLGDATKDSSSKTSSFVDVTQLINIEETTMVSKDMNVEFLKKS